MSTGTIVNRPILSNVLILLVVGEIHRLAELKLVKTSLLLRGYLELPTVLHLVREVKVSHKCFSVCRHKDKTYVGNGFRSNVDRILADYKLERSFIQIEGDVDAMAVDSRGVLYTLSYESSEWEIYMHVAETGAYAGSFSHADTTCWSLGLAIVGDRVIIPNRTMSIITVYKATGSYMKSIGCDGMLGSHGVAICAFETDSVIVSSEDSRKVFRVNIDTGEKLWVYQHDSKPGGVSPCGPDYVIMADMTSECPKFTILDAKSGE